MKKILIFNLLILIISCKYSNNLHRNKATVFGEKHEKAINNLLAFFQKNAYKADLEVYFSDIDNIGQIVSNKVYNVALSRLIYGFSFASAIDNSNLNKAKNAANFQMNNLIGQDSIGSYFISFIDVPSYTIDSSLNMDIWQQGYGLCGLSELYRNDGEADLLSKIHRYHNDFVKRFHDDINGGFYGNYNNKDGKVSGSKSLQSLMYPITAYMENLWSADAANRNKYEPYLKENLRIAYDSGWNRKLGWVNIKFDDAWQPCEHPSAEKPCFTVAPGHNFQFASLLLRTKNWDFLTPEEQTKYQKLGIEILTTTLKKQIYPKDNLSQGFYSEVNPVNNKIIDKRKTWWQHCEALIALSLADRKFEKELKELEQFYFNSFPDKENGGEFFYIDENNIPQADEKKGNIGKSTYHTVEMIRFLNKK